MGRNNRIAKQNAHHITLTDDTYKRLVVYNQTHEVEISISKVCENALKKKLDELEG